VESSFPKLFTVGEANALLPRLKELLEDVARHRDSLREKAPHMEPILRATGANGGGRAGSKYGVEAYRLFLAVERIRELGVILLDFPHERDGRIVYLCWHPPEERVAFWHEIEAGYAGRQPL
jgi:hypothetical protein